jgi:cation transport regulator ChaB
LEEAAAKVAQAAVKKTYKNAHDKWRLKDSSGGSVKKK